MTAFNNETLLTQLRWRYAVKRFDASRKLSDQDWDCLAQTLVLTPSSYGLQPYKFIVVQNPEIRKQLRTVSWNQSQVEECSHYVVFTGLTSLDTAYVDSFIARMAEVRGVPTAQLTGYRDLLIRNLVNAPGIAEKIPEWSARQAYLAFGSLMTAAALMKIDACPIEGIEGAKYDEILQLQATPYRTLATCALGYRHPEDAMAKQQKVRLKTEDLLRYI